MTRIFFILILIGFFTGNVKGQVSFSPVDSKLQKSNNGFIYSSSTTNVKFPLKRQVTVFPQKNFVTVDSHTIQIMALKFEGIKKTLKEKILIARKNCLTLIQNMNWSILRVT